MGKDRLIQLNLNERPPRGPEYEGRHPVAEHLMARANRQPPFEDGREIDGYYFGGFVTTVNGVGVSKVFQDKKLSCAFDKLYGSSAGFLRASELMTPEGPERVLNYLKSDEIVNANPLNPMYLWRITNPKHYLSLIEKIGSTKPELLLQHPTQLFARVRNYKTKECKFVQANRGTKHHYENVLNAAMKLPFVRPGGMKIEDEEYNAPVTK